MKIPTWMRLLLAAFLLVAATACGGDDSEEETGSGSTSAPADDTTTTGDEGGEGESGDATELTITAEDYTFDVGDEIEGGIVEMTLENEGNFTHEAAFIKVADDYDIESFEDDFGPVLEGGPISDEFETITGVGEAEGGDQITSTITLPEGSYVLMCTLSDTDEGEGEGGEGDEGTDAQGEGGDDPDEQEPEGAAEGVEGEEGESTGAPPHYTLGMLQMVSVTGPADVAAADIEADGLVEAVDYGFEFPELEAGDQTLVLDNASTEQIHHAIWMEFPEGVDEAQAQEAIQALLTAEGPPPEGTPEPEEVGFSFVFGPGMGGTFDVSLESGRTYAVACFLQDREGGPPHAIAHEMVDLVTIS